MNIIHTVKSWFWKQEQRELASDERHEHSPHSPTDVGHKEHMTERTEEVDREIADDQGL